MKKYFQLMSMMLCMMAGALVFASCGDDEEEEDGPNNNTSITEADIIGSWYGIDEDSSSKIDVFVINLERGGRGYYQEFKAKKKNEWEPEEESVEILWTLKNGTLTMTFERYDEKGNKVKDSRVGDVLKKNSDGTLLVRRHLEGGKYDEITLYQTGEQGGWVIFENLLRKRIGK